jgi:uracil-DNA glycosylase family 4
MTFDPARWKALEEEIIACRRCSRLVEWREEVARVRRRAYRDQEYWGKPVPGFGDPQGRIFVAGLAPGAHGSNRTGRMFTGDASGDFLYPALYETGFASQPDSTSLDDGLELTDLLISSVCRCVPPKNKPVAAELETCRPFLLAELGMMENLQGFVALGRVAFDAVLKIYRDQGHEVPRYKFGHAAHYELGEGLPWVIGSFHPSRQNTQTGRLTFAQFKAVWELARQKLR